MHLEETIDKLNGIIRNYDSTVMSTSKYFMALGPGYDKMEKLRKQYEAARDPDERKKLRDKMNELTKKTGVKAFDDSTSDPSFDKWDSEVDPEIMKVVPTINKILVDEATRISNETGKKVYPKDIIDSVLKSLDPSYN